MDFDWKFYISNYKDLNINDEKKAIKHWKTIGMKEGRICNSNGCNFDWVFYKNYYSYLNIKTINEACNHYIHSKNFICCEIKLKETINKNMEISLEQSANYIKKKIYEEKLNILIRTSNRPHYFKQAINSIINQNYKNYKIYVSYDKKESLKYLTDYNNINIEIIEMNINNPNKYKFNLYNNYLMDKVEDGYILFLDDDDIYIHNNVFNIINDNLTSTDDFLIWKFMRPDKLIYPKNNIKLGTIDTTSFCFHNNFKNLARWGDKQCGDFRFVNSLLSKKNFNIKKIDYILTKTIFENKIASFGN
jgi:hypothetical protein